MYRQSFKSTRNGLDHRLYPMRLWKKAKKLGTWDPAGLDFTQDKMDWATLNEREQDLLLRLTAQFQGGEESVTYDLLPILLVMAQEGRIEEEMFLTAYLWEEAKHVEGFDLVLREVMGVESNLEHYFTDAYKFIFQEAQPRALHALKTDASPEALAYAAVTYQMITEGVLAETGYHAYYNVLEQRGLMPGLQTLIRKIQQDESRHIGYGVFLLSRLVAEHGDPIWKVIEARMNELIPFALQNVTETLAPYGEDIPFGVKADDFLMFGMSQFQKRFMRIEKARTQSLDVVYYGSEA